MTRGMRLLTATSLFSLVWIQGGWLGAQTAPPAAPAPVLAAEGSRLRQMESIYQMELRTKHIVLLGDYLTELQKLAAQALDPAPYQAEMASIQSIISSGGIVDLAAAAQALRAPAAAAIPQSMPRPLRVPRALIALTPALARNITPVPDSSSSPEAAAIGEIQWRIESLPAGTYELILQYACPSLAAPLPVRLDFARQRVETQLDPAKATASADAYRLLRLGQFTLPAEIKGETLRLQAGAAGSTSLLVRQLLVVRAQTGASEK